MNNTNEVGWCGQEEMTRKLEEDLTSKQFDNDEEVEAEIKNNPEYSALENDLLKSDNSYEPIDNNQDVAKITDDLYLINTDTKPEIVRKNKPQKEKIAIK